MDGLAITEELMREVRRRELLPEFLKRFNPDQPRVPSGPHGGEWVGDQVPDELVPIVPVTTIEQAIERLGAGQGVMFERPEQVVTLLHKIRKIVERAKERGEEQKVYDLCKVYVAHTNLFCEEHVHIPRSAMPQLKGKPTAGSLAANRPDLYRPDKRGRVDLTNTYVAHLRQQGMTVEAVSIDATRLRAAQNQIDGAKVAGIFRTYEKEGIGDRAFLVSKDHYIVDGHHHWAAQIALGLAKDKTVKMNALRVSEKILPLLKRTKDYTKKMGIPARAVSDKWWDLMEEKFNPDQPRIPSGPGGGQWVGEFGALLADIAKPDGGFTYSLSTHHRPTEGFALSLHQDREQTADVIAITPESIVAYAVKNWDLLKESNNYLGAWHNPENDKVYFDVSTVVQDPEEAATLGRAHGQLAYYDLKAGKAVTLEPTRRSYGETCAADTLPHWVQGGWADIRGPDGSLSPAHRKSPFTRGGGQGPRDLGTALHLKFNPHHLPAGTPEGGQFASAGSAASYPKANPQGHDTQSQYKRADGTYTPERAALHEKIVNEAFAGVTKVERPSVYFIGGGVASGKSTIFNDPLARLPTNAVHIDADAVKGQLPEYREMIAAGNRNAAGFTHEESTDITALMVQRAGTAGVDTIYDGIGNSSIDKLRAKVETLRARGQRSIATYVTVPTETAIARAIARGQKTGRMIPPSVIAELHANVSKVFPEVVRQGIFDHVNLWDNRGDKPVKIATGRGRTLTIHDHVLYGEFLNKAGGKAYVDERRDSPDLSGRDREPCPTCDEHRSIGTAGDLDGGSGGHHQGWLDTRRASGMDRLKSVTNLPALVRLAERLVPSLRARFLAAVQQVQDAISLEELALAIERNNLTATQVAAKLGEFPELFGGLAADLKAGFFVGSNYSFRQLGQEAGIQIAYRVVNPAAVSYAETHLAQIVRPFVEDAKELISDIMADVARGLETPRSAAQEIRELVGLDPNRVRSLRKFEERLLADPRLDANLIERKMARETKRLLTQRARVIARNEAMKAANAGKREAELEARRKGLLRPSDWERMWIVTDDERLCPICEPLDGEVVGFEESFAQEPPLHVQCRCTIRLQRFGTAAAEEEE